MYDTMVTIVGNLVDTPVMRPAGPQASVTSFRVASTSRRFDKDTQSYVDKDSLFVRVQCWRQFGDNVARSLVKGDPVVVVGRLFTRRYEVDGVARTNTEMEAVAVGPDLSRGMAHFTRQRPETGATGGTDDAGRAPEDEEDPPLPAPADTVAAVVAA